MSEVFQRWLYKFIKDYPALFLAYLFDLYQQSRISASALSRETVCAIP